MRGCPEVGFTAAVRYRGSGVTHEQREPDQWENVLHRRDRQQGPLPARRWPVTRSPQQIQQRQRLSGRASKALSFERSRALLPRGYSMNKWCTDTCGAAAELDLKAWVHSKRSEGFRRRFGRHETTWSRVLTVGS